MDTKERIDCDDKQGGLQNAGTVRDSTAGRIQGSTYNYDIANCCPAAEHGEN